MKNSRPENTAPQPIKADDALRSLTAGVGQLDGNRAAAYGELATLRTAKQGSLERREKIYAVKYGADHPRVRQIQKRREINQRLRHEIYVAHTQAATPAPVVGENSYVFHGFVRNRQRQPLPRLTVALYDENGEWLRELGYGCTDEHGYFLLRYTRDVKKDALEKRKKAAEEALKKARESAQSEKSSEPAETKAEEIKIPVDETGTRDKGDKKDGRSFEIRVYDAKQTLLHRETQPLTPELGTVDYREIIIDDCGGRCVPPPGSTDTPPPPAPVSAAPAPRAPARAKTPAPAPVAVAPSAATAEIKKDNISTPLENIKGVGPKTAAKLRATGIKDVETLKKTPAEKIIALAGTDKKTASAKSKKTVRKKSTPRK